MRLTRPATSRSHDQVWKVAFECRDQPIAEQILVHSRRDRTSPLAPINMIPEHCSEVVKLVPCCCLIPSQQQGFTIRTTPSPETPSSYVLNVDCCLARKGRFVCKADIAQINSTPVQIIEECLGEVEAFLGISWKQLLLLFWLVRPEMKELFAG